MYFKKNRKNIIALSVAACCLAGSSITVQAYIPTNRDAKVPPETALYEQTDLSAYTLLYETEDVRYYYRDDRDIFAVEDKATGYCMKTGADLPFKKKVEDLVDDLMDDNAPIEEILAAAESYADDLNTTYVGIANSLITVEYYDSDRIKYFSSASDEGVESTLSSVNGSGNEYLLAIDFQDLKIQMNVYITLGESSITYFIPRAEMTGNGLMTLAAIDITPFLGASGGRMNVFSEESMDWETVESYRTPGYVLVPDGSGSLIRFVDNTSTFNPYVGDVYGKDYATETYYNFMYYDDVPVNDPVMPVFGITHGYEQMAFVAWADQGAEYMDIIVNPDETMSTSYTWAYPRFEYNISYFQLYDELGSGFFTQMDEIFDYDVSMTYSFLFGDGTKNTPSADYAGMAREYRQHLLDIGELTLMEEVRGDIPIRLDFIMADSENGIIGTNQVVVTTAEDVGEILDQVAASGITNVNSGLIGWQRKGETLSKPASMSFSGSIGTKRDFRNLIEDMAEKGMDVSLSRDLITVNRKMLNYYNTAVKAISNWYVSIEKGVLLPENLPVTNFSYATPVKAAQWLESLSEDVSSFSNSFTVTGMTNVLTSNYNRDGAVTTLQESIQLYREAMEQASETLTLNLENPNMYLWKYTDRYLQMPVGSSQYIYETDSVPFLQMVLYGTMEMYGPYCNFSFYTQDCVLRMIDYNISPSFILSKEPSWNLANSFSANLYSTEFGLYEELIGKIYWQINDVLSQVQGCDWLSREIPEDGVVINTYTNGSETLYVIINYTENEVTYHGITVAAESAAVAR